MFQYLYEWMTNAAFYLVIFTAVIQLLPNGSYHKYVRFFTGLILILLVLTPVFKIFGMEQQFWDLYSSRQYEQEQQEIENSAQFLSESELFDFLSEEAQTGELSGDESVAEMQDESKEGIHVEEIRIGE
ncbi:MAG: stage III sporulation protein AF [Hespellia sp.]|nr:stage III sporulation protein AF [Hespellia sp.]